MVMSDQLPNATEAVPPVTLAPATEMGAHHLPWLAVWALLVVLAAVGAEAASLLWGPLREPIFLPVLTFLLCLLAAWHDAAVQRVPNALTYTGILIGLAFNVLGSRLGLGVLGATDTVDALQGFALCAGIGLACLMLAGMGGGDVKLLAAIGALLGYHGAGGVHGVVGVLLWALALAVAYALVNLIIAGRLNALCQIASLHVLSLIFLRQPLVIPTQAKGSIPLAVPLVAGLVMARVYPLEQLLFA